MLWFALTSLALAGRWDDVDANIYAEVDINAPYEVVQDQLLDLRTLELYSDECVSELTIGAPSIGYGAPFRMRFHAGPWSRLVEGRIAEVGARYVDVEHTGKYGFTTRYLLEPSEDGTGTHLKMTTFLDPPPWPFKPIFYRKVRPGWTACHDELVTALAAELDGRQRDAAPVEASEAPAELETSGAIDPIDISDE